MVVRNNVILLYGCTVPVSLQKLDQLMEQLQEQQQNSNLDKSNAENWTRLQQYMKNRKSTAHWTLDERIVNQFLKCMNVPSDVCLFNDKNGRFYIYLKRIYVHEWNMIAFDFDHDKKEMLHCDFCGDNSKQFDQRCAVPTKEELGHVKDAVTKFHDGQMYNVAYMSVHYTS